MHDLLLAKQIINEVSRIAKARKIAKIKRVELGIGSVILSHDNFPEHAEEINFSNLKFVLESLACKNGLGEAKFNIKKIPGQEWRIIGIEIE